MLQFLVTIVAVAVPAYLYMHAVRGVDRYEKEPTRYLVAAFLWGAVPAVTIGVIVELILGVPVSLILGEKSLSGEFVSTAFVAPVVEEILKGGAVAIIYLWRRREFDGWVDGIVYGATDGFGFAYVENVFYIASTNTWGNWLTLFFLRVVVFGLMHGFWTSLTGIGFGLARNMTHPGRKTLVILVGLGAAIFSHMVHNGALVLAAESGGSTLLLALGNYAILLLLLICLRIIAARNDRAMLQTYLRDEVPEILSETAYADLCSTRSHAMANLRLAPRQQRDFIQVAAELAQKKREFIRMGNEDGNGAEIERLRAQLATFGK
jgi:RsiW-degrading membrane proteinase PrsW (M82 family)